jgi:hypothetical protein
MEATMETIEGEVDPDALRRRNQEARRAGKSGSPGGPGALPSWKFLGGSHAYTIGGLTLTLKPLPRRAAREVYDTLLALPVLLQVAAQCGTDSAGERLDFERMAAILSALSDAEIDPALASAQWRDFCVSEEFDSSIALLAEALAPMLENPAGDGLAWPRPQVPAPPVEGEGDLTAWEAECEALVAASLTAGCRWLDDAIEEELHDLEIPLLLTILFDVQGGFPGDVRERFTRP